MLSKFNFFLTFLFFSVHFIQCDQNKKCNIKKYEEGMRQLTGLFGYTDIKWPENESQMSELCSSTKRHVFVTKNFTLSCLKGLSKSLSSVTIYSVERATKTSCKNKIERNGGISAGKCGNQAKLATIKCFRNLINMITNAKKLSNSKDKISVMCCTFYDWRDCTLEAYRKTSACSESNIENLSKFIDTRSINPMNLMCSDYDDSDKCDKYNTMFDRSDATPNYKTILPAIFDLLDSI